MNHWQFTEFKRLAEVLKKEGYDEEPWIQQLMESVSYRWDQGKIETIKKFIIQNKKGLLLDTTFDIPHADSDLLAVGGQYKIGTIANSDIDFGLSPLQLQMHGVIGGQSGFGKSSLTIVLAKEILKEGKVKVWVIDPKQGGDYRSLARLFGDLVILNPETLKCNPFSSIPNVSRSLLREAITEVLADSFGLFDASEGLIASHLDRIFREHEYPTLFDLAISLSKEKRGYGGRKGGYLDSIQSRLGKTLISLESIVDCLVDQFSQLYDRSVVFEVGDLSGSAQRQLVPWIILKLVLFKVRNPSRALSHLLIFDEAQSELWSKQLELRGRQSFMATTATQVRAFGCGIIVLAQNPATKLMTEILSNANVKICFHLGSGQEIYGMAQTMGLTRDQMEKLYHLDRGEAICRVGLGYTEPVHLNVYDFEADPVSDEELRELMQDKWDKLQEGIQPAREKLSLPAISGSDHESEDSGISHPGAPGKTVSTSSEDLSANEESYLRIVSSHPWRLVTEVYKLLGDEAVMGTGTMSQATAVKIRKQLLKKDLLESYEVKGTGKSGRSYFDVPTEKANMGKLDHPRGDPIHSFWCFRVAEKFRREGATVKTGETVSGHEVDIGVEIDG